jgi:hypothetical protein
MHSIQAVTVGSPAMQDFLGLPSKLYDKKCITQDKNTELQLINNAHPVSTYITFNAYVVYAHNEPVARFALTLYPDKTLYIGFFECIKDQNAARYLFEQADNLARAMHVTRLVGPVDASFWIKYRLKTSRFNERPYTAEPYNLAYYKEYFHQNGFVVTDRYVSTEYRSFLTKKRYNEFSDRYKVFKQNDYQIVGINKQNFEKSIRDIYAMLMELYADFPVFKHIEFEDFYTLFYPMLYISSPHFAKIAYCNNEPAGFVITLPDYNNLLTNLTFWSKLRISLKRIRASQYVMLYMGVRPEHRGLSRALIKVTVTGLYLRLSPLIGALIHEGKPTENIAPESINNTYEYVLMAKDYE